MLPGMQEGKYFLSGNKLKHFTVNVSNKRRELRSDVVQHPGFAHPQTADKEITSMIQEGHTCISYVTYIRKANVVKSFSLEKNPLYGNPKITEMRQMA